MWIKNFVDARVQELMKKDRRFKTVVCRHWVKGLCMKLDKCEFLHELNTERMPECRWGEKCQGKCRATYLRAHDSSGANFPLV